jgi:uncharacterized protein YecT (DUF1311 family)
MKSGLIVGLVAVAVCATAALAQPKAPQSEYQRCVAASGHRDAVLADCERAEWRRQDQALNDAYKQLDAKLDDKRKAKLRNAQRAWLTFRNGQCAYETSGEAGGTIAPVLEASCLKRLTEARVEDLRRMLSTETF